MNSPHLWKAALAASMLAFVPGVKSEPEAMERSEMEDGPTENEKYEEALAVADVENAASVRLRMHVFETEAPIVLVRDDISGIPPHEEQRRRAELRMLQLLGVYSDKEVEILLPVIDEKLAKEGMEKRTSDAEGRIVSGGKYQPIFEGDATPKGWEECRVRALFDEDRWEVEINLAMNVPAVGKVSGLSPFRLWNGQWLGFSAPVKEGLFRTVFMKIESTEPPKPESEKEEEDPFE